MPGFRARVGRDAVAKAGLERRPGRKSFEELGIDPAAIEVHAGAEVELLSAALGRDEGSGLELPEQYSRLLVRDEVAEEEDALEVRKARDALPQCVERMHAPAVRGEVAARKQRRKGKGRAQSVHATHLGIEARGAPADAGAGTEARRLLGQLRVLGIGDAERRNAARE